MHPCRGLEGKVGLSYPTRTFAEKEVASKRQGLISLKLGLLHLLSKFASNSDRLPKKFFAALGF